MSIKCEKIVELLEDFAPKYLAEEWDNVGLLIGDKETEINKVLICLDVTEKVVLEAIENNCNLIISHHPIISKFVGPINFINNKYPLGRKIISCIKNNICVYSIHTNLDITNGGTNDYLFDLLGLKEKEFLCEEKFEGYALGRIGKIKNGMSFKEFIRIVKNKLNLENIIYVGDLNKKIDKVGLCTGSCSGNYYFDLCIKNNCDVYITSDIKHHDAIDALEKGLLLIDATHYATEFIITDEIFNRVDNYLKEINSDVEIMISGTDKAIFNIF